jgi:hypothetical protein
MRPFFQNTVNNLIEINIFTIENCINVNDPARGISAGAPSANKAWIIGAGENGYSRDGQGCGYVLAGGVITDEVVACGNKGGDLARATFEGQEAVREIVGVDMTETRLPDGEARRF